MEGFNRGATNKKQPSFSLRTLVNTELSQITRGELQQKKVYARIAKDERKSKKNLFRKRK